MPFALLDPRWLWLLALCWPAVWLVAFATRRDEGWTRGGPAVVRAILLTGLVVAAAQPVLVSDVAAVSAVALLDVSASVTDAALDRERRLVDDLRRAASPPHELTWVSFARTPIDVHRSGAKPTSLVRAPGDLSLGTDIAGALGLATGLGDPTRTRRILLISDGRATVGDSLGQAARLAALGVRVDVMALGAVDAVGDVAIASITAPGDIRPRAAFPLRVGIAADRPALVRITLTRDGEPAGEPRVQAIPGGETFVTWDARIDAPGTAVFVVSVETQGGAPTTPSPTPRTDAHPENDRGVLAIATDPPPRALILAGAASDATALVAALRAQAIDTDVATPPATGGRLRERTFDVPTLARTDLIVLCDLPRAALSEGALAAIEAHVRDGGGLLVTGGPHSFGPGRWDGSRLEPLLPVRLDAPQRRDEPALALALVIDRSGSMSGAKMELTKKAARATADMLPPDDQLTIVAFDREATTIVPMQRAANRSRIATDIARIQATGGTNILAGLREAVDHLLATRAQKKHAILLSDGQSATDGIAELVDAAAAAHITLSTVGVGDGVDEGLLQSIARDGGGRYHHTRDPSSIPRIFTREASQVAMQGVVERPTTAVLRKRAPMLEGVTLDQAPRLGGYVRTHARQLADVLLATEDGDPLLARWSLGLGQVVAWTSDLGPRWADAWARWPSFAKLWGQIARATMRPRAAHRFPLTARVDAGVTTVSVEAIGDGDRFLSGLDATLEVTEVQEAKARQPPRPLRRLPLAETAPGRYEATFATTTAAITATTDLAAPAALLLLATLSRDHRPVAVARGHVSIPTAPELQPLPSPSATAGADAPQGATLLAEIAARTGGSVIASPSDLFRDVPARPTTRPLRTPLLVALALLFIVDVALRRLTGRGAPVRAAAAPNRGRGGGRE